MSPAQRFEHLNASEAASLIEKGDLTSEALVGACFERIGPREPSVGAWAYLDRDAAVAHARRLDREARRAPLHGIPVGIKDIIDTADMPTAHGSPIYEGNRPNCDAACVAMLRSAGAVVLGKTVTTEFAAMTPGKTRNPLRLEHTPGGSSSGSAAAVADFMVPVALGTQTVGSTIRPASYCGVVGFKPTYHTFSLAGVKAQSESMDTLGLIARSVSDIQLVGDGLLGVAGAFEAPPLRSAPHLAFCRSPHWPKARPATIAAMERASSLFRSFGAPIEDVDLPPSFDRVLDAQWTILSFEFARVLAYERTQRRELLSERLCTLLDNGTKIALADYRSALSLARTCRAEIAPLFERYDAILTPAASGEAPHGLQSSSDLLFQRLWTVLHLPAITLPGLVGEQGLPIGVQLVGRHGGDANLLTVARWAERVLQTLRK